MDAHDPARRIERSEIQRHQLADPDTRRVEQLHDRAITQRHCAVPWILLRIVFVGGGGPLFGSVQRRLHQPTGLLDSEYPGQLTVRTWTGQQSPDVGLDAACLMSP